MFEKTEVTEKTNSEGILIDDYARWMQEFTYLKFIPVPFLYFLSPLRTSMFILVWGGGKGGASYTDKNENQIFLIYKEIQNGAVAKSYMTNGLLIYGEIFAHFLIQGGSDKSGIFFFLLSNDTGQLKIIRFD
jgi:hypothetical protein